MSEMEVKLQELGKSFAGVAVPRCEPPAEFEQLAASLQSWLCTDFEVLDRLRALDRIRQVEAKEVHDYLAKIGRNDAVTLFGQMCGLTVEAVRGLGAADANGEAEEVEKSYTLVESHTNCLINFIRRLGLETLADPPAVCISSKQPPSREGTVVNVVAGNSASDSTTSLPAVASVAREFEVDADAATPIYKGVRITGIPGTYPLQILLYFFQHPTRRRSAGDLVREIWGPDGNVDDPCRTIANHLTTIRKHLKRKSDQRLYELATQLRSKSGYIGIYPPEE